MKYSFMVKYSMSLYSIDKEIEGKVGKRAGSSGAELAGPNPQRDLVFYFATKKQAGSARKKLLKDSRLKVAEVKDVEEL